MNSHPSRTEQEPVAAVHPNPWHPFVIVVGAAILNLLDTSVTNIAAPSVERDIGGGPSLIQWLGSAYTLALAAGLLLGGRLGDMFGRRRIYCLGMAGFVLASLACGLATSPGLVIAARVVQGLSASMVLPQSLGVIRSVFPPERLGKAFGIYGPVTGLAALVGPVLAGFLVSANLFGWDWRLVFLINIPLGLGLLIGGWVLLPSDRQADLSRLDIPGVLLASTAAVLLVFPLVEGRESGWRPWTWLSIMLALVLFGVFVLTEQRGDRAGRDTLVAASLFRSRVFTGGLVLAAGVFSSMVGTGMVLAVFLQRGLGLSPLAAALVVLPQAVGNLSGFLFSGSKALDRMGRGVFHLGIGIMAAGVLGVLGIIGLNSITAANVWTLCPPLALYGAGMGIFLARFFTTVLANVKPHEYGSASGSLNSVQQFSGSLGIAVLGTTYFAAAPHAGTPTEPLTAALAVTVVALTAAAAAVLLLPRSEIGARR